jgi:DNA-binding CsgD family transcriptional regulator
MLVGREADQQVIARFLAGARLGNGGVLALEGEAGIGKSALLDDAVERSRDMTVLRASGSSAETGIAFGALLQLLRPTLGLVASLPGPQARALEVALALREGEVGDRFAIGAACLLLLSRLGEDKPVLAVVDDAHDLDRPSAEAIVFAARRLLADRVGVLVAFRPTHDGLVADAGFPVHHVDGLDIENATRLVARSTPTPPSSEQLLRLYRATRGNPLALLEFARDVPAWERTSPVIPLPAPEAVAQAFTRRLDEVSAAARLMLLVAAVADGDQRLAALACERLGADMASISDAENAGLVTLTPGRIVFRHPLVRSAVYGIALPGLRRDVHRTVADLLPAADLERRAWNLAEATVGQDAAVADLVGVAGERLRQRGAYADAAAAFERAALLTPTDSQRPTERLVLAAECAWLAGAAPRATILIDEALALGPDAALLARVQGLKATVAARTGSLSTARTLFIKAATEAEATDPDTAVLLLADAMCTSFFSAKTATGLEIAEGLERLMPSVTEDRSRILGKLAIGIGRVLSGRDGIEHVRLAVAEFAGATDSGADPGRVAWLTMGPLFLKESHAGRDLLRRAVEDRRQSVSLGSLPLLMFHLARDDATTDRWAAAEIGYEEAVRLARESGQTTDLAMCLAGLAWLHARTGREQDCRAEAHEAERICREHDIGLGSVWTAFALGELELGFGRAEQAVRIFDAMSVLLARLGVHDVDLSPDPERVEALLRTGNREQAHQIAVAFSARAEAKRQPWALARAERALGSAVPAAEAEAHFERALALHGQTDDLFELARSELAFGVLLRRERRKTESKRYLVSALRSFEELGARPWADQCAIEVAATGGPVVRRGSGPRDLLTPQELQIAAMLGEEGRTTKKAAAALFLSPKTIEYHLRHVYEKLGIGSRDELRLAMAGTQP